MFDALAADILQYLPTRLVSRLVGRAARVELPDPLQSSVNRTFARLAGVDVDEARRAPGDYDSLQAFFTRRLCEGARPVDRTPGAIVSPVDGRLGAHGEIGDGTLVQAKGRRYELYELLDSRPDASVFEGGSYLTLYLSPGHYHRIHSPVAGRVERLSYVPGRLLPVNDIGLQHVDRLFAVNERLITFLSAREGRRVAVVKVGATCVGRIAVTFDDLEGNRAFARRTSVRYDDRPALEVGDELGVFNLGSTVVLLCEGGDVAFAEDLESGDEVRYGQRLGRLGGRD
ncbi:MAG: archaetidylserine decarboxylase [Bradymonadaceae bacterium]